MGRQFAKTAVLGPIVREPFGVAGSCADCIAASSPRDAEACPGFGPGCLGMHRAAPAASTADDLKVRLRIPK